jgi:hypothetical protein
MALSCGAMAMRAIMILAGEVAITEFKPILLVFAGTGLHSFIFQLNLSRV